MEQEILMKIESGVYEVTNKRKGKSAIWNVLKEIKKDDGSFVNGHVFCASCRKVLKFNGKQTTNMLRHKCVVETTTQQELKKVELDHKKEAVEICTKWVVQDCKPYSAVEGAGFKKMINFFIKMGAKYGENIDIDDLIPSACTISRQLTTMTMKKKDELKADLAEIVNNKKATITTDLWSDHYVKRQFICATLHFEKDLKMNEMVLGVKSMDFERATGGNIKIKLKSLFAEFGIYDLEKLIFVTDRGANIKMALNDYTRLNCSNHLLANVMESAFETTSELQPTIIACRKLVKYFKKSNIQHLLSTALKNYCPTRWNTHLNLFQSIADNWDKIKEILADRSELCRIADINLDNLKSLVLLCQDFDLISKKLQSTSSPSICFVVPSILRFQKTCEAAYHDVQAISTLKLNLLKYLNEKWFPNLSMLHKIACFLYPPAKQMQAGEINDIIEHLTVEVSNHQRVQISDVGEAENTEVSIVASQGTKEMEFFFPETCRPEAGFEETVNSEILRYSQERVKINGEFDVLQWWHNRRFDYQKFSKYAMKVLSIPASSAASERVFSLAGNLITDKRNRLAPKSVDNILFLNSILSHNL